MSLVKHSADVFIAKGPVASIGKAEIETLKAAVDGSTHGRVRINAHDGGEDRLHEMFIALKADSYIRPHKHPGKSEAFHLVHGAVDIVILTDEGSIQEVVRLAAGDPERAFYYRLSAPFYHTLLIRSDILVIHEITNGPFRREDTVFAPFAPTDNEKEAAATYMRRLDEQVSARPASAQ